MAAALCEGPRPKHQRLGAGGLGVSEISAQRNLVVPSIRAAEKLSARELDAEMRRLTDLVRKGKTTPSELGSGTFTINNYGVFG
ncbi:2-oxo acid dehydrogenase subunit E2 [Arthrobacter sp. ISL-48]|uniref:2-oxo acid dehydrogenase subunit E2 n=1 Tax=Arthrobacter sp. ISL-48 TaxID=2819110 RepID=UPI0037BEF20E